MIVRATALRRTPGVVIAAALAAAGLALALPALWSSAPTARDGWSAPAVDGAPVLLDERVPLEAPAPPLIRPAAPSATTSETWRTTPAQATGAPTSVAPRPESRQDGAVAPAGPGAPAYLDDSASGPGTTTQQAPATPPVRPIFRP